MREKRIYLILIIILAQAAALFAIPGIKHIGTPIIRHYARADFNAGRQTWMIGQGGNGMMYFANNDGLLEFDGKYWNIYPLPNQTIVRSVRIADDGRIYAGGFNEFGYFLPDDEGRLHYHSLKELLPADMLNFGDIWKIHLTPFGVVFQSFSGIFIIQEGKVEIIQAPGEFHFSYYVKGELYVVDRREGLLRLALGKLFPVVGAEILKEREIWGMLPYDDKLLIATDAHGIYVYDGDALEEWAEETSGLLSENKVFCMAPVGEGAIAFGTIQDGLFITDLKGNILQSINRGKGLQNNTVLSINTDDLGNLWLGLDNGIDYIEISSPLSLLTHHHGLSSGYAAVIHDGLLYLGTNQGVYATDWEKYNSHQSNDMPFRLVENTGGQVWMLQVIDGKLFCGHNNGTFLIDGFYAKNISEVSGGWKYLPVPSYPDKVIAGTYSGFILFEKGNGEWTFSRKVAGFDESSRDFYWDKEGSLWMSHGLKGIFRIYFNEIYDSVTHVDFYSSANGLPSDYGMTLFRFRDSVYINTIDGIFRYDENEKAFKVSSLMASILGSRFYRKLTLDRSGNIWYFTDSRAGVMRLQEDGSFLNITVPFEPVSNSFIGGFEFVYPYDQENVFFGNENGFVHYDPSFTKDFDKPITTYIRNVASSSLDTLLFSGMTYSDFTLSHAIGFNNNDIQFFFSANDFENPDRVEYCTYLSNLETGWSAWGLQSNREFTNLPEGDYVFKVKARNLYQIESDPVTFFFRVDPPWRRSLQAYILYIVLFLLSAYASFLLVRRKIHRSKREAEKAKDRQFRQREEELEKASLEAEKEVIRLRNEKLREEMKLKDKELANSTLQMIQKNKLLVNLKDDLKRLASSTRDEEARAQIRLLTRKINKDIDTDSQWKVFETQFEKVHEEFLNRIKAEYPDLTPRELKLCAYLRLNISSKEIALLMNISTRGVEISRYRLRKKLNLPHDTNLTDFIISF